ncbi:helix-turn-helix domain-containing protein [Streptomyces sp. NBC_00523]|uniref:helix-turn-helix domain-containing protein n=1 Tax=unclassified Streptomyces TaxID=2593676 RepID=UPI002E80C64A|nr:helix-turn-helix domain-containing protein [Streptomyces sp. NBC_00523]WUD02355.1 helix-turn-helix domain-containing protein [Streptomyces sp. NBC_00523]
MLDVLGLDAEAEVIYRAVIRYPCVAVAELAAHVDLTEQRVRESLNQLEKMGLVQPTVRDGVGYYAVSPESAMEALLSRQQAELTAQQLRVESSRAAAAQLVAAWSGLHPRMNDQESERLIGPDAIRDRLALLAESAKEEIATFAPGGAHTAADLEASRGPNAALLNRGVRMRTIYLDSIRHHRPTLAYVTWLNSLGGQVRTAPVLPIRMVVVDRRQAMLPIDTDNALAGAVVLKGAGTIAALCALFESVWGNAVSLGITAQRGGDGIPAQERAVLALLAQGYTDEAVAKRLGVSPRTARRTAASLLELLDARSRFEAGVHAVQDGWLPASR